MKFMVITRFAPSPTGTLHIGSVRTILFNYLFAKRYGGKFRLRIEDTDKERCKEEYVQNIFNTLKNLELEFDGEVVIQSANYARHKEVAYELLNANKAYKCYCTQEELEKEREELVAAHKTPTYSKKCRNLKKKLDKPFTIRLKVEPEGKTEYEDLIQGLCGVENEHLDDMILLRSDETPTYMLAVVVDDHDMGITHVIRGSEHLNNAYRQIQIYKACGWEIPKFAHVSLIHAENGEKLSKRTGAKSVEEYQSEGFIKEAILNYLMLLGWYYGEDEIISVQKACEIFDLANVRPSAARFDLNKLLSINSIYLKNRSNADLLNDLKAFSKKDYSQSGWARIKEGLDGLKSRVRTLSELSQMCDIYGEELHCGSVSYSDSINQFINYAKENDWNNSIEGVEIWFKKFLDSNNIKMKDFAPIVRLALTNSTVSPSLFEVIKILGRQLCCKRLILAINNNLLVDERNS